MELPEREGMDYDVVIVGGGPAGLATAIRLKQLNADITVVVVEKGSEIGAHILSGAVIDPIGLDALLPDWRKDAERPLTTEVTDDQFLLLGPAGSVRLPNILMPKLMGNHGNFIGSLGQVTRWMGAQAEALGVEIYPGFSASEVLYSDNGAVTGIATGDVGIARSGEMSDRYTRGMELRGKYVIFAEGARGQLTKQLVKRFKLDEGKDPQKYGIGLKELWQVAPDKHRPGLVQHTFGWPLDSKTGGGSFLYHFGDGLVSVGFVVHLNYENPHLSPFDEFQRYKTHPAIRDTFEGGKRLSYGARAITEGGWQSVPKLCFPGGALVGCAAGFVNVPRIKGSHNAVLSGMLCAEHISDALKAGRANDELAGYEAAWRSSAIGWSPFGTLKHGKADFQTLKPAAECKPITYPKPDGVLTFDKLSSVFISNTNHEEDQPAHLKLADSSVPISVNLPLYGEPARLYCPAGVYEVVYSDAALKLDPRFVINAQNCVHCKTCDIKDPSQNITWVAPEGGGGPNYPGM
jgi:electron-transferring-flavoprotein dehydrogenase